jgi:peptidoglycan/xylan/chitin deacetylase (PgdA/CDA1 family)
LPILRAEGIKATLSIVTGNHRPAAAGAAPLLTWDEITAHRRRGGREIAAHSDQLHRYETDNPFRDTAW